MREESNSNHICILKTGRLLDHDLAANALSENNIPFYKQMETITGLKLAMPFQPAMVPGTFYNFLSEPQIRGTIVLAGPGIKPSVTEAATPVPLW